MYECNNYACCIEQYKKNCPSKSLFLTYVKKGKFINSLWKRLIIIFVLSPSKIPKNALHLRFNLLFIVIYSSFFRYYCGLTLENSFLFIAGYQTRKIIDVVVASQWLMHDSTETSINLIFWQQGWYTGFNKIYISVLLIHWSFYLGYKIGVKG